MAVKPQKKNNSCEDRIDIKTSLFPIIAIALIALFFCYGTISADGMLPGDNRDIITKSVSETAAVKSILEYHQFPLWNNLWFTGIPEYASIASPFYYPLATFFYLVFGAPEAYNYIIPLHIFLSGVCFWIFSSTISSRQSVRLYGAVVYMLSGMIAGKINMGHLSMFMAHPYIPLSMFFLIKAYSTKDLKYVALAGLSMSMFVYVAAIYYMLFFMFMFFIYAFFQVFDVNRFMKDGYYSIDKKNIKISLEIFALFILLIAVRLLPALSFTGDITRMDPIDPLGESYLLKEMINSFLNNVAWGNYFYIGFIPVLLSIVSVFHRSKERYFMYASIGFFFVWAAAKNSFFWWIHLLPFLDSFRNPLRTFAFVTFVLVALSLYGFEIVLDAYEKSKKHKQILIGFVSFIIFFELQEFIIGFRAEEYVWARFWIILTVATFSIVSWALINKSNWKGSSKKMAWIIMSFTVLALVMNNITLIAPEENPLNDPTAPQIMQAIKGYDAGDHTQIWIITNGWAYQHQEFAYHAVKNDIHIVRAYYSYFLTNMPSSVNIGNQVYHVANYIIDTQYLETGVKADMAGFEKVADINDISVYKIENSLPNAFIVGGSEIQSLPIKYFSPNKVVIDGSKIKQGDLVVLKTAYYKGWKANGKPAINAGNMLATTAEISNNDITFNFAPADFKIGLVISLLALLFCILVFLRKDSNNTKSKG